VLGAHIDRSRTKLPWSCATLCPPAPACDTSWEFDAMQVIRNSGKIAQFGVLVDRIDEA
jgi:hypothetical protein